MPGAARAEQRRRSRPRAPLQEEGERIAAGNPGAPAVEPGEIGRSGGRPHAGQACSATGTKSRLASNTQQLVEPRLAVAVRGEGRRERRTRSPSDESMRPAMNFAQRGVRDDRDRALEPGQARRSCSAPAACDRPRSAISGSSDAMGVVAVPPRVSSQWISGRGDDRRGAAAASPARLFEPGSSSSRVKTRPTGISALVAGYGRKTRVRSRIPAENAVDAPTAVAAPVRPSRQRGLLARVSLDAAGRARQDRRVRRASGAERQPVAGAARIRPAACC